MPGKKSSVQANRAQHCFHGIWEESRNARVDLQNEQLKVTIVSGNKQLQELGRLVL